MKLGVEGLLARGQRNLVRPTTGAGPSAISVVLRSSRRGALGRPRRVGSDIDGRAINPPLSLSACQDRPLSLLTPMPGAIDRHAPRADRPVAVFRVIVAIGGPFVTAVGNKINHLNEPRHLSVAVLSELVAVAHPLSSCAWLYDGTDTRALLLLLGCCRAALRPAGVFGAALGRLRHARAACAGQIAGVAGFAGLVLC